MQGRGTNLLWRYAGVLNYDFGVRKYQRVENPWFKQLRFDHLGFGGKVRTTKITLPKTKKNSKSAECNQYIESNDLNQGWPTHCPRAFF
jgi:hypothetical protein